MLLTLVKNNFKLMIRDRISILFLVFLPILLIALLSSAFSKIMNKDYSMESFNVGYNIEKGSDIEKTFPTFIDNFKENKIILSKMSKEKALEKVKDGSLAAYMDINDKEYTIYKEDKFNINAEIFQNSMDSAMYLYDGNKVLISYLAENKMPLQISSNHEENKKFIKAEYIKVEPMPDSSVYYGITEIIYIIWFGMMAVSSIVSDERKSGVTARIGLTNANSFILFLGKLIPAVCAVSVQVAIAAIVSTILMDVNWGNLILSSAGILILEIIASSAIGIAFSMIIKSQALVNVIIFILAFVFGFIGGTFQPYMYNFVGENISKLSPLYYTNRTLVEFSTKGYSNYTSGCVLILLSISVISIVIGITSTERSRRAI